jgi:carboxypeptidase PM20D1
MKSVVAAVILATAVLCGIILVRAARLSSRQMQVPPEPPAALDMEALVQRLSQAIQFRTLSQPLPEGENAEALLEMREFLSNAFPRVHRRLQREIVNGYSLLYTWTGKEPDLAPILLMAHMDVVPIEPGSSKDWTHPPFAGRVADGYIWGRGAMDDKGSVMAILEAVEHLLGQDFRPRRTVYLAFGHDEETGGLQGAARIAELLKSRSVAPEFVLDEGGNITEGIIPGIHRPVALIGVAEKGYASLEFKLETPGGHSSMPPARSAIGILSGVVSKLENTPFPTRLSQPMRSFFEFTGAEMSWPARIAIANLWLFDPLVRNQLAASSLTASLIRTTQAVTIFHAGIQDNVLPARAQAVVNFRILTGDTIASVVKRVRQIIGDSGVRIAPLGAQVEPSPVADVESNGFQSVAFAIRATAPGVIVAPFLLVATTDSRYFAALTKNIFRFLPISLKASDVQRYHGINERIAVADYERSVRFYLRLLLKAAG